MKNIDKNEKNKPTVDLSRRRLAKLGLIASPILSTLPGKPAMAMLYSKNNCTVSGNMSGNMSENVTNDPCASVMYSGGHSAAYWTAADWSGTNYNQNDKFNTAGNVAGVFEGNTETYVNGNNNGTLKSFTLMEVVNGDGSSLNTVDLHQLNIEAVAALLNAGIYSDYGYTQQEVITLYEHYYLSQTKDLMLTFQYLNSKR